MQIGAPSHVTWIFATRNPEKMLDMLRNRCVVFKVYLCEPSEIKERLLTVTHEENIKVSDTVLQEIANRAKGMPREALILLEKVKGLGTEKKMLDALGVEEPVNIEVVEEPIPEFQYPTFHLKDFEHLDNATRLYGKDYKLLVKAVWYILFSQVIKPKIASLGDNQSDCRMNFVFVIDSGRGKGNIKSIITKVCESLGEEVVDVKSWHPEALVGRVDKKHIPTNGLLDSDILIFDEADHLVSGRDPWNFESRKYMTTALDLYGKNNRVIKRPTGIPKEHQLSYCPKCSIQILMHVDEEIPSEVISKGFFRRFLFLFPDIPFDDSVYDKRIDSTTDNSQSLKVLTDHLKEIRDWSEPPVPPTTNLFTYKLPTTLELTFSVAAVERYRVLHRLLIKFGKGHGKRVSRYTEMIGCSLENLLLGMIIILASSQKKNEIGDDVVEMAFVDLIEFLDSNFKYIEEKVKGKIASGKKHPIGSDLKMCEWLKERGETSIKMFKEKMKEFGLTQSRYKIFKKNKWIKSTQVGQYDSKIWLTVNLDGDEEDDSKISEVMIGYRKIIDSLEGAHNSQVEKDHLKFKDVGRMIRFDDIEFPESLMS